MNKKQLESIHRLAYDLQGIDKEIFIFMLIQQIEQGINKKMIKCEIDKLIEYLATKNIIATEEDIKNSFDYLQKTKMTFPDMH